MSVTDRIDAFQRKHPAAAFPLGVIYKYIDDAGSNLAALIAYYAFVSLFPLLLLASTILGLVLVQHPELQARILASALSQIPVVGQDLGRPRRLSGGTAGIVIGVLGSLYGGLGVAQAVQTAMNTAWTVPKNSRPNPFAARGRSLLLLLVIGGSVLGTLALSAFVGAASFLGPLSSIALFAGSILVNSVAFCVVFKIATTRPLSWAEVAPGAVAAAVLWQLLQIFGIAYVSRIVNDASTTNGTFAIVLGLLGFLYLTSVAVMYCVEINVVRVDRLYPRSLLTPFTDNVVLTTADRESYTDQAKAQRSKGFQRVDVSFDQPDPDDDGPS